MLPFAESFAAWVAATTIPTLVGITAMAAAGGRAGPRLSGGFALGVFFWFFLDTIEGSADLSVSSGFGGGVGQIAMVLLFAGGLLLFFSLDTSIFSGGEETTGRGLAPLLLASLAVGMHGLGEGAAFGSTAYVTSAASLLKAFGGLSGGAAYAFHKLLEPMMVGALYVEYSRSRPHGSGENLKQVLLLTLAFALPSALGALTGYFIGYDTTYLFALGAGTSVFVAFRLAKQVFLPSGPLKSDGSFKVSLAFVLGFILIYLTALLHS